MIDGLDEGTRSLLAQRFKRLHDEAQRYPDPPFSPAYRALGIGIEVMILMGPRSVGQAIRGKGDWGSAAHALFGDLWEQEGESACKLYPTITRSSDTYDKGVESVVFSHGCTGGGVHVGLDEDGPFCRIGVSYDDDDSENFQSAGIRLDIEEARYLCGFLHEWLAAYEG